MTPNELLESQLRECYGRVVYTHKTHEKCADSRLWWLGCIKTIQIALSAVVATGFIAIVLGESSYSSWVGGICSVLLLGLNIYRKDFDLGRLGQKHRTTARDLWRIREKYLSLITDLQSGIEPVEELFSQRDALLDELHGIYSGAPSTTARAYRKARKALKIGDEMTFSDEEIDRFLPSNLKRHASRTEVNNKSHKAT